MDGPYDSNDTLMLRAETGPGRNLTHVLLLAAAAVASGRRLADDADSQLDRLVEARAQNKPASSRSLCCPLVHGACGNLPGECPGDAETDELLMRALQCKRRDDRRTKEYWILNYIPVKKH